MAAEQYDIVVVGAGIHGAGVAQAAAARGHSVLVLERADIADATSSRSSKLIHGGLRYLETGQFSLVRECLHERALLLRLAPELVQLRPFYIPVYDETRRRPWQLRLGLGLYALLTGLGAGSGFGTVPRGAWATLDGLDTRGLRRVFRYWDAQTDDAALTRAVMDSALSLGARLAMPARFLGATLHERHCSVRYEHDGRERQCEAAVIVNAAGPWVNHVLTTVTPDVTRREIELVQGTHIVVDGRLARGIYYMEAPGDGRAVFAMPWHGRVLVGTTETAFRGDPGGVAPLPEEQDYLLDVLARYFPGYRQAGRDVIREAFAGLRVLPADGSEAFRRPRETLLHTDRPRHPRVLTIYGGKLTAYRATADKVMRQLRDALPHRTAVATTDSICLTPPAR